MSKKSVLVACGAAVATSTVVANAIEEIVENLGITVDIRQCKAAEVPSLIQGADLVVSTTPLPPDLEKPAIVTLAFLTGVGKDEVVDEITRHLLA